MGDCMGMYDEISIRCPKCDNYFYEQSKAGDCTLHTYSLNDLPDEIDRNLIKQSIYCPECGAKIKFVQKLILIPYCDNY